MARTASAEVLSKQARGIAMLDQGKSYDEIAEELGYANRGSAWRLINRGLQRSTDERAGEYLDRMLQRLEYLLDCYWDHASEDLEALRHVLDIMVMEDRLLGLTAKAARPKKAKREPFGLVMTQKEREAWERAGRPEYWRAHWASS